MNIDINGLGEDLIKFQKQSHKHESIESLTGNILSIFDKFGVTNADYNVIKLAFNNGHFDVKKETKESFSKSMATDIFEREKKKEELEAKANKEDKHFLVEKFKSVSPINIYNFEVSGKKPEEITQTITEKFLSLGFSSDDMLRPMSDFLENQPQTNTTLLDTFKVIATSFSSKFKTLNPLNITNENSVENESNLPKENTQPEIVNGIEVTPKMKQDMEKYGIKNPEDYEEAINELKQNGLYKDKPEISQNDEQIEQANALPEEELPEDIKEQIEEWGVEGINNMNDWKDFQNSAEYEMLQNMKTQSLSKNDSNEN